MAREKTLARTTHEPSIMEPWNNFREMENMFRDFFMSPFSAMRSPERILSTIRSDIMPEIDLKETESDLIMTATIPGMNKDDINIDVTTDSITISGERKSEEEKPDEKYHIKQQSYGSFNVSYSLPVDVKNEEVKAKYKDGILEITMPKTEIVHSKKVNIEVE